MSSADTSTDEDEAPEVDEAREQMVTALRARIGDAVLASHVRPGDEVWVRVRRDAWHDAVTAVRDDLGCAYFDFLSGLDWLPSPYPRLEAIPDEDGDAAVPEPEPAPEIEHGYAGGESRFQVMLRAVDPTGHLGIVLKVDLDDGAPTLDSVVDLYSGAEWHEREAHEMYGFDFTGHPDMRFLYLPTGFEGHPLRKDFPLLSRMVKPWPGIVDVEPMPESADDDDVPDAENGDGEAGDSA